MSLTLTHITFHPIVTAVICHMEGSGKWPHDRLAIRHIRAAFHITLGQLLKKHHNYVCRPCPTHLDVWKVSLSTCFSPSVTVTVSRWCNVYGNIKKMSFIVVIFLLPALCTGWSGIPYPSGLSSRASGAKGEPEYRRNPGNERQWGSTNPGESHHSQASADKHITWVKLKVTRESNERDQILSSLRKCSFFVFS